METIVLIQQQLLVDLDTKAEEYNKQLKIAKKSSNKKDKRSPLKLDVLVKLVSLFNSIPCQYRDDESKLPKGIVRLDATRLRDEVHSASEHYMRFLKRYSFIERVHQYDTEKSKCRGYKLKPKYETNNQVGYTLKSKTLLKKMHDNKYSKEYEEDKKFCEYKRPHLVRWFNENLSIDKTAVFREIEPLRNIDYDKYSNSNNFILDFDKQYFKYSIDPRTDNRLHTTLSMSNKIIRKHIYYNNENIVGLDVRTSQPYFLCAILKAICNKDKSILEQIGATKILDDKIIFRLFNLEKDEGEVKRFGLSVLASNQDFYNDFAEELSKQQKIKYNDEGLPYRRIYIKKEKQKLSKKLGKHQTHENVVYEDERELAKKVVNEIFNSSPNTTIPEAITFRKTYLYITKVMKCIKDYGVGMWRLLSYVEAYCLLDYSALKFHEKYPDIFITSIHDSLVITESNIALLEREISKYLMEVTTLKIPPKFKIEDWRDNKVETAV